MSRYLGIGEAAKMLGVSIPTLRRWDKEGKLTAVRTPSGHRRYPTDEVSSFNPLGLKESPMSRPTIAYARVSSHDQKKDLERQVKGLEMYGARSHKNRKLIEGMTKAVNDAKAVPAEDS